MAALLGLDTLGDDLVDASLGLRHAHLAREEVLHESLLEMTELSTICLLGNNMGCLTAYSFDNALLFFDGWDGKTHAFEIRQIDSVSGNPLNQPSNVFSRVGAVKKVHNETRNGQTWTDPHPETVRFVDCRRVTVRILACPPYRVRVITKGRNEKISTDHFMSLQRPSMLS